MQTRYRRIETSAGVVSADQMQDSMAFAGRVKLDARGKYTISAGLATGNGFTSGWNNTGVGTGDRVTALYLKQLYGSAAPVKGVDFSDGGLSVARGLSTEITTYDNDG